MSNNQSANKMWWGVSIFALVVVIFWVFSASRTSVDSGIVVETIPTQEVDNETIEAIDDNPAAFIDQNVTVTGKVDQAHGPHTFTLATTDLWKDRVIVFSHQELPVALLEDIDDLIDEEEIVTVVGTVRAYDRNEVSDELNHVANLGLIEVVPGEPVIIADRVTVQVRNP